MAVQSVNFQCPACSGPLHFDATTQKLKCDYCDSTFTPEEAEEFWRKKQEQAEGKADAAKGAEEVEAEATAAANRVADANQAAKERRTQSHDPVQDYLNSKRTWEESEGSTFAVVCQSCGATLAVSSVEAVTTCPYCGNNSLAPGRLGNTLEPDYVLPFSTTKEQAVQALSEHYKGKICLPKEFKDGNHIQELQGIYVPFWLYDGKVAGEAEYTCTNVRVFRNRDEEVTETDTWNVERGGICSFTEIPADASKRMPNEHMDAIEPFDYSELKPFSSAYLPGFAAERYDDEVQDCAGRAKVRMEESLKEELNGTVTGYDSVICNNIESTQQITKVSYALLPVWMLHTKWKDQDFLFAMNGQTGKLVGDLPCDKKKLNLLSLVGFVAGFAASFCLAYFVIL